MTVVGRPLPERRGFHLSSLPPTRRARPLDPPNATLAAREEVTATLGVFVVVTDQPLGKFRPGQYVSLGVISGGEFVQRPYSIVSIGSEGMRLEFFVRRLPDGRLSNMLWALAPGARVHIGPVKGLFTLDDADARPRLMIGTGTGLAPLLAMLDELCARGDSTPTTLIHGASFHAELAYRDRIGGWIEAGLPLDYRATVSRPQEVRNSGWSGLVGRAEGQLQRLLEESPSLSAGGSVAYLCGNPDMIEACSAVLVERGFGPSDIHVEQFHAPLGGPPRM
jgi:ferredoxin-NADP reductase